MSIFEEAFEKYQQVAGMAAEGRGGHGESD